MSSNNSTEGTDKEICEILDPNKNIALDLSINTEVDSNSGRRPERKRNLVKRQLSFIRKVSNRCVPLSSQDSNQNIRSETSEISAATNQNPVIISTSQGSVGNPELRRLFSMSSNRFACRFGPVVNNIVQTWNSICDLEPLVEEKVGAFRMYSQSEDPSKNAQKEDLKDILANISLESEEEEQKEERRIDIPEQELLIDTVKTLLDKPREKSEDSSQTDNVSADEYFNQIISNYEFQNKSEKAKDVKPPSAASGSSALLEVEFQSSITENVEAHIQKDTKVFPESSTEKMQVDETAIRYSLEEILNEALANENNPSSPVEESYQSILGDLKVHPYPGDCASSEATIKALEYNLNHRVLQFCRDVPILHRKITNFLNRIECLVRKWPLDTKLRTLKQYLAFVLDVESKLTKCNLRCLSLKYKIESDRLKRLSGGSRDKKENSDCSIRLHKKYYIAVKYISILEELRSLSEKFYSYINKDDTSLLE